MKKIIPFLICGALTGSVNAQVIAYFSSCSFNTPDNKSYMETYLSVLGSSVSFKKNEKGKFQGSVEVGILFSQNGEIKVSKKYNLMSPEQNDTLHRQNFIDQQRFSLDTGVYELECMLTDKNGNGKILSVRKTIQISYPANKVNISDIELLSSYTKAETKNTLTKNGFDLVPYTSDFFPENISDISLYAEIYNTKTILGEGEKFLLTYYIESFENNTQLPKYTVSRRETASTANILLTKLNITELASGNYNLVVEVRNKMNELMAQRKVFFQRKNPNVKAAVSDLTALSIDNTFASRINSKDTITEFIRSLRPIASSSEKDFIDNQLKLSETKLMQQFFYNFWHLKNPLNPEEQWNKYYAEVKAVNAKFGTFSYKGYETDRGRVYLQYGPPDKREESPSEPNAYPYEMWVYYRLTDKSRLNPNQTNKQFIFYNRDLSTNNFRILHSDALSETHDTRWEMKLHGRSVQSHDFEHQNAPTHYGGKSSNQFNNPK